MKNVVKNYFYQTVFQLTKILLPIITVPIVSNAIGPEGIGVYNYTKSIAQYFVLMAGLGISLYGNREIALSWNRKENISKVFWEIFSFKFILSIISSILYLILVFFIDGSIYFYVQVFTVLSVLFDISWFFMGVEDFKKTSLVNLLMQIISFFLIIFFVNDSNDTLNYVLIQVSNIFFSQVFVWIFIKEYISFEKINIFNSFRHFRGSIEFFIPQVAILLYTELNKTLLGFFLGEKSVGYYTNSLTLNLVFITIITTLDTVLLPHMSSLFAKDNIKKIVETMETTIHLQLFFSIPIMFGMLVVYDKLVPWFFGEKFLFINKVIPFFSILIVVVPLGMAISRQYLLPIGKTKEYNKSVIIGAIINIVGNLILIPSVGFFGVVFTYIISECFVTIVRTYSFVKSTQFQFDKNKISKIFLSGIIMYLVTRLLTYSMNASITTNVIQFIIAIFIYLIVTSLLKVNLILPLIKKLIK